MTTVYQWRVFCTTDSKHEYLWSTEEPTVCPTNTSHSIDAVKTAIVDTVEQNLVTVKEESTPTGGVFACKTLRIDAIKNTSTSAIVSWPYPISALSVNFVSSSDHEGDFVSVVVGKDTVVGALTANVTPGTAWVSQNYTAGQVVTYTHPDSHYGTRVYTCTTDTVSSENPTDSTYWMHGLELAVSQTVIDNVQQGYFISLDDNTNEEPVGRITFVDTLNSKIYVETNPLNSYAAVTPTYVKCSAYTIKDYEICEAWEHDIGVSKIGGTYIPTDTKIEIIYQNTSTDTDKVFMGRVEYLY